MQMPVQQRSCRILQAESLDNLPQHSPTACGRPQHTQAVGALHCRYRPFSAVCKRGQSSIARQRHDRCHLSSRPARCTAQSAAVGSLADTEHALLDALEGTDRGIFGVPAEKRNLILNLIQQLEGHGSTDGVTSDLQRVGGDWRLLFSTISITGKRRTKLGLRNFISLGDFTQSIEVEGCRASNRVDFAVSGLAFLGGFLQIDATYQVAGPKRVSIDFEKASLEPSQLQDLFAQHYDMLLSIFNPAGWLDITYLDDRLRVGRDDKSNVFLLERI